MLSRFRKLVVIGAGAALLVGLTAGPLAAASSTKKTYSVNVTTVGSLTSGASSFYAEFNATYTNTTPGGTSSFNSLTLSLPTGSTIDTSKPATFTTTTGSSAGTLTTNATAPNITVTNLYPVSYSQSVTLDFWATVPIASQCSTVTWATQAFTGSNLSGTLFTLSGFSTNVATSLAAGSSINVSGVTVTNGSTTCVPVTISRTANNVQVLKPSISGVALTVDILWDPEPAKSPLPWTQVSDSFNTSPHNIEWCGGTSSAPALPGDGEVSCLVSESSQIAGSNTVQVHDVIYLLGDWGAQR